MSITISVPEKAVLKPKIVVFGVGGGGCNAVNNMIDSNLEGVDFVVSNTDAQSLSQNRAERCIQMGVKRTQGLGAGSQPEVGYEAAEEVIGDISDAIHGAHMVFVTAGMGGGTGTGAAPVVARLAKEMGALTVGVVTKPFLFEGNRRMRIAEAGIAEMEQYIDTLLIIPNQNLFRISNQETSFTDAFKMADKVLLDSVGGITNLMIHPGIINLDFADVRTVMGEMGQAMIGTGEASGEDRGIKAAEQALNNPLLDDVSMKGARGVLISISGSDAMTLYEVEQAMQRIRSEVDEDAQIIPGTTTDNSLGDILKVSVVATGIGQQDSLELPELEEEAVNLKVIKGYKDDSNIEPSSVSEVDGGELPAINMKTSVEEKSLLQKSSLENNLAAEMTQTPQIAPAPIGGDTKTALEESVFNAPPPPPLSALDSASQNPALAGGGLEYVAGGIKTFLPPSSNSAPDSKKKYTAPKEGPKGLFGRIKARLMRAADDDSGREHVPLRNFSSPPPTPPSPISTSSSISATPVDNSAEDEDQLEIPTFLKSQTN